MVNSMVIVCWVKRKEFEELRGKLNKMKCLGVYNRHRTMHSLQSGFGYATRIDRAVGQSHCPVCMVLRISQISRTHLTSPFSLRTCRN